MPPSLARLALKVSRFASDLAEALLGLAVMGVLALLRLLGPDRASNIGGRLGRIFGPLAPAHRHGLANLKMVFPEKSEAERRAIMLGAWECLGRTAAEYAHLDRLWDYDHDRPGAGRIEIVGAERFIELRDDGKPAVIFAGHLGNWEMLGVGAMRHGLPLTAVYRAPNNRIVDRLVRTIRRGGMGDLIAAGPGSAFRMMDVLERGAHLGLLVDQRFGRGLAVDFLGHPAMTNPIIAKLARRFECPVHGARVVRLPGNRFRLEITPALELPRDATGAIDVAASIAAIQDVIAGWVREHPEQWLWQHRRWRR